MALIKSEALVEKLNKLVAGVDEENDALIYVRDVLRLISVIPSVDAVEVVRCRDCRYWRQEVNSHTHWVCTQHSFNERLMHTLPDFYCKDGKREG